MSGCLVRVADRKRFDFSYLAGSASQSVVLYPNIDAIDYCVAAIYTRVHERKMASGQLLTLSLYNTLPSDEDAREFVETDVAGSAVELIALSLTNILPSAVPGLSYSSTTSPGPYLKFGLSATQASAPATFYVEIRVAVLLRTCSR